MSSIAGSSEVEIVIRQTDPGQILLTNVHNIISSR